jgi:hypothetical protein
MREVMSWNFSLRRLVLPETKSKLMKTNERKWIAI